MLLTAHNFLAALTDYYNSLYENTAQVESKLAGHKEKLGIIEAGYSQYLENLIRYIAAEKGKEISKLKILDFGCGTGELTVLINKLGAKCIGLDIHKKHLDMAATLAKENNLPDEVFHNNTQINSLPYEDNYFDLIVSFSVFEHLEDTVLAWLLSEFNRVSDTVYTLVPNPLKPIDDHTNLAFLGIMNRKIALKYISFRGADYKISRSGSWDVYYRYLSEIVKQFHEHGFKTESLEDNYHYPPLTLCPPISSYSKTIKLFKTNLSLGIPLFPRFWRLFGVPKQNFYPYLNLISRRDS